MIAKLAEELRQVYKFGWIAVYKFEEKAVKEGKRILKNHSIGMMTTNQMTNQMRGNFHKKTAN